MLYEGETRKLFKSIKENSLQPPLCLESPVQIMIMICLIYHFKDKVYVRHTSTKPKLRFP